MRSARTAVLCIVREWGLMAVTKAKEFNPDRDRFPRFSSVLSAIQQRTDIGEAHIERLEVTALASGEATYRIWRPRAEEPEGGYFAPDELT
jgi:hypothetical protein